MDHQYLHTIIVDILQGANKPLSANEILQSIDKNNLWSRVKDGNLPSIHQIQARISKHPELFIRNNKLVSLKNKEILDERLLRLTWNDNNWNFPSPHKWSKENQGKSNIAHENQYGFGGEEWLFNPRYNIDGFQYGLIQGLWNVTQAALFIDTAYLFSIDPNTKDRCLVGILKNIELLDQSDLSSAVVKAYAKYEQDMINELKQASADYSKFKMKNFYPVAKFRMQDALIFNVPRQLNEIKGRKYNRFQPYILDNKLKDLLAGVISRADFKFNPGKRKNENSSYIKTLKPSSAFVAGLHAKIIDDLEIHLKSNHNLDAKNISIEKTLFGDNIADIVVQNNDKSYSIYEVKTSSNARYNIRESIGQLLDYAFWHDNVKIKELIIVSPSNIDSNHIAYLNRISKNFRIPLRYLCYNANENITKQKFMNIKIA